MKTLNHVMLIEDDDIVNFYNEFLLKNQGIAENVTIVHNGREALEYLEKADNGVEGFNVPELIFLDINMPVMNGFEFLEEYETRKSLSKADALIVMLTSSMHPKDQEKAKTFSSVSEYLYKPLMEVSLKGVVERYFPEES